MRATIILLSALLFACDASGPSLSDVKQPYVVLHNGLAEINDLAAGNNNDIVLINDSDLELVYGHASGSTITGFDAPYVPGKQLYVQNIGPYPVVIAHESSASAFDNRLYLRYGRDTVLRPGDGTMFVWDGFGIFDAWYEFVSEHGVSGEVTTTTPSRALGAAFQPQTSAGRLTMVSYAARAACDITIAGGQRGRIELRVDSNNPPTTVRGRVACGMTGTVVVGVALTDTTEGELSYLVPAGDYVLLDAVNEVGTPTYSITTQSEQTL